MACMKLKSTFSWLAIALLLCISTSPSYAQQVGTNCSDARIRRSWDSYNASEKALYKEAVGVAMDRGFHQKFIQVHVDYLSEKEAHQNCMFIYWHRMMLLGYENMLRSLDPRYRCLTLPYWDHLTGRAKRAAGKCSTMVDCTSVIPDTGGMAVASSTSMRKSLVIYNVTVPRSSSTSCVGQEPLSHFCGNNTPCARCILRNSYAPAYPSEASFSSVYQQVFSNDVYNDFRNRIETGVHNTIHSVLGGVMAYFQSPADPVFYMHHGLVDLLQTIYLKCQVGAENVTLSATDKGSDPRWFSACARRTRGSYTSSDNITMQAFGYDGKTTVNVWQDPKNILYPFFKDIPYKFADYVDAKDLGNYSYTYAMSGGLATMYQYCKASNTISTASTLLADEVGNYREHGGGPEHLKPIIEPGTAIDDTVRRWNIALFESARIVGYTETAAREQMEMVACQYQEDCLGGVQDYTDLFRTNFDVDGHPRCYTIMQYLNSGDRVIGIPKWKEITLRFLPCAAYKKRPQTAFEKAVEKYASSATS